MRLWRCAGNELDISGKPPARQWIAAIYFAVMMVTTVGLGDIKACTPAEEVLASFQMLLGVFLFGLIVSTSQYVLTRLFFFFNSNFSIYCQELSACPSPSLCCCWRLTTCASSSCPHALYPASPSLDLLCYLLGGVKASCHVGLLHQRLYCLSSSGQLYCIGRCIILAAAFVMLLMFEPSVCDNMQRHVYPACQVAKRTLV